MQFHTHLVLLSASKSSFVRIPRASRDSFELWGVLNDHKETLVRNQDSGGAPEAVHQANPRSRPAAMRI